MLTTRPLAVQTVAAVADMQHCHLNVRAVFSILHTVSEPSIKWATVRQLPMCEVPPWTSILAAT